MPAIGGVIAISVDYSAAMRGDSRLQQVIDSAAVSVAREMTIARIDNARAQTLAQSFVAANIPANTPYAITVNASLVENGIAVKVDGTQQIATPFGTMERLAGAAMISASATARVTAKQESKLCLLSLGQDVKGGIYMHNGAQITANGCTFQSNSTDKKAVILSNGSTITADVVCARGGIKNTGSRVVGSLITDCPEKKDPLASKPEPAMPLMCSTAPKKVTSGTATIPAGKHCGGIEISGTAKVTLQPGLHFISSGEFLVKDNAELVGDGVTLMLVGQKSFFRFEDNALIQLSAPKSGPSAGMLIWEAASFLPITTQSTTLALTSTVDNTVKLKKSNEHHINSDRARQLTGTIYLRRGLLLIDAKKPIADMSPYTIMVVEKLDLYDGPNLVLNSNYDIGAVPIPAGLGPIGATQVRLGM